MPVREESEAESARRLDHVMEYRPCPGCGKSIYTDRCHRFCERCTDKNRRPRNNYAPKVVRISKDAKRALYE